MAGRRDVVMLALVVRDYDEAISWYRDKLDFVLVEDRPMTGKRWVVVAPREGATMRMVLQRADKPAQAERVGNQTGGRVFLFLHTDDFARDHAAWTARGVRFIEAPRHEEYGVVCVFEDLYGNKWDLIEPKIPT